MTVCRRNMARILMAFTSIFKSCRSENKYNCFIVLTFSSYDAAVINPSNYTRTLQLYEPIVDAVVTRVSNDFFRIQRSWFLFFTHIILLLLRTFLHLHKIVETIMDILVFASALSLTSCFKILNLWFLLLLQHFLRI
jgi:hypothetical protein